MQWDHDWMIYTYGTIWLVVLAIIFYSDLVPNAAATQPTQPQITVPADSKDLPGRWVSIKHEVEPVA